MILLETLKHSLTTTSKEVRAAGLSLRYEGDCLVGCSKIFQAQTKFLLEDTRNVFTKVLKFSGGRKTTSKSKKKKSDATIAADDIFGIENQIGMLFQFDDDEFDE